jgi:hypothetical protein
LFRIAKKIFAFALFSNTPNPATSSSMPRSVAKWSWNFSIALFIAEASGGWSLDLGWMKQRHQQFDQSSFQIDCQMWLDVAEELEPQDAEQVFDLNLSGHCRRLLAPLLVQPKCYLTIGAKHL